MWFTTFHGMLINPYHAYKCIEKINGKIIFISNKAAENIHLKKYKPIHLNLLSYYGLVIGSLTGLSTLLGMTQFIEINDSVGDEQYIDNTLKSKLWQHLEFGEDHKIIRFFSYYFILPGIDVKMYHVKNKNEDKLHLIELYTASKRLLLLWIFILIVSCISIYRKKFFFLIVFVTFKILNRLNKLKIEYYYSNK
mgnify:CR=1 FL=1